MRAILLSVKPKWVAKILNGEKIYEIRKTMPRCDLPVECYLYVSKDKEGLYWAGKWVSVSQKNCVPSVRNGKVVAKFTLNKVEKIRSLMCGNFYHKDICLTTQELNDYLGYKGYGYAWHIENLVIFDKEMELSELNKCILYKENCYLPKCDGKECPCYKSLTKAPQSWCYLEVAE